MPPHSAESRFAASCPSLARVLSTSSVIRQIGPDELDEMVHLYQRTGANLAHARVEYAADAICLAWLLECRLFEYRIVQGTMREKG